MEDAFFSASKIPGLQVWRMVGVVCAGLTVSGLFFKKTLDMAFKYQEYPQSEFAQLALNVQCFLQQLSDYWGRTF